MERSYSELIQLKDYHSRLEYLKLLDGNATSPRHISGDFYRSDIWKAIRADVMKRDCRFDLGIFGLYIEGPVYVHHINPISEYDILNMTPRLLSLDNLISSSLNTHNAIHYKQTKEEYIERQPGDTILWERSKYGQR